MLNYPFTPQGYAYTFSGISVRLSARGIPYDVQAANFAGSWNLFGGRTFYDSVESATACLPVLTGSPTTCRIELDSKSLVVKDAQRTISATGNGCTIESPTLQVDPLAWPGATVAGACTDGHAVGMATIVIGATNQYAQILA